MSDHDDTADADDTRSIELEVEVPGTPEEVWRAVATGPGITSWFVPAEVEERAGGRIHLTFGPGIEDESTVDVWEPPHRFVYSGEQDGRTMAFELLVEARDGGSCVVRLINSGFGTGEGWDEQYDGMAEGWKLFLQNLRLHLERFAGQECHPMLISGTAQGDQPEAYERTMALLGLPTAPAEGERIAVDRPAAPPLAGTVVWAGPQVVLLEVDAPAPGTAFIAGEGGGEQTMVSVWIYLYGEHGAAAVARDEAAWRRWMAEDLGAPAWEAPAGEPG